MQASCHKTDNGKNTQTIRVHRESLHSARSLTEAQRSTPVIVNLDSMEASPQHFASRKGNLKHISRTTAFLQALCWHQKHLQLQPMVSLFHATKGDTLGAIMHKMEITVESRSSLHRCALRRRVQTQGNVQPAVWVSHLAGSLYGQAAETR